MPSAVGPSEPPLGAAASTVIVWQDTFQFRGLLQEVGAAGVRAWSEQSIARRQPQVIYQLSQVIYHFTKLLS
jgi:hypothetical protein